MANACILTGKKTGRGFHVSHSNRHVKRIIRPNLQTKRLVNPATGRMVKITISTRGLRTLRKWMEEGRKVDLTAMKKEMAM